MKFVKKILILLNILLMFSLTFMSAQKEESYKKREDYFYLRLSPVDPRSLMQGDYMILNYDITDRARSILYNIRYDYDHSLDDEKISDNIETIVTEEETDNNLENNTSPNYNELSPSDMQGNENTFEEDINFFQNTNLKGQKPELEIVYNKKELQDVKRAYLVVILDENRVGQLVEIVKEKYEDSSKLFIPFKYNDSSLFINANSYLFQEGEAEKYEKATYSKVVLTDKFLRLIDLVDKDFKVIK